MKLNVQRLSSKRVDDFRTVHAHGNDEGWCQCVAWWTATWEGWGDRTAEQNRRLRNSLFDRGEYDGYLLYRDLEPIGWIQVGTAARLPKLCQNYALADDPEAVAITCFFLIPTVRGSGLTHLLLARVLEDLKSRGVERVLAFPRCGGDLEAGDVWTGPESTFRSAGFVAQQGDADRPVLSLDLASFAPAKRNQAATDSTESIRFVLFDLGGVLVDNAGITTILEWTRSRLTETELWDRWLHSTTVRAFESGEIESEAFLRSMIDEFELDVDLETFGNEFAHWIHGLYPGSIDLLKDLRGRCEIGCLSNTNSIHWERMFGEFELGPYLEHRFASFQMGMSKPDREIFDEVLLQLEASPSQVLFLDDSSPNIVTAREVGLHAYQVEKPEGAREVLTQMQLLDERKEKPSPA